MQLVFIHLTEVYNSLSPAKAGDGLLL